MPPKKKWQSMALEAVDLPLLKEDSFARYREDFVGYARDVLGFNTDFAMQREILQICSTKPSKDSDWHGMLAVSSGTNVGKTACVAVVAQAVYDCWGPSCLVITTAPTQKSVEGLLWSEIRTRRGKADPKWGIGPGDFIGPSAPMMKRSDEWMAQGLVATKQEMFKGRHKGNMLLLFDEAVAIPQHYFTAARTMFKANTWGHLWVCCFNPTDPTSPMYNEVNRPDSLWKVVELSSLQHPNIIAELQGLPPPIPNAVSLSQFEELLKDDADPVSPEDVIPKDIEFPPLSNQWWRPGPLMEANGLGRWPSDDEADLWSDALWNSAASPLSWADVKVPADEIPRIGCDVARKGFNRTAIAVALGDYLVHLEAKQGQNTMVTVGRIVELCQEWCDKVNPARRAAHLPDLLPRQVPIKIDSDGVGGACDDRLRELGYLVYPINAQAKPHRPNRYPDKRSELWYDTRDRARAKKLHLGLIPKRMLDYLKRQAKAPKCEVMSTGQRQVERKEVMAARLEGESPDGMDALNLAFYTIDFRTAEPIAAPVVPIHHRFEEERKARDETYSSPTPFRADARSRPRRRLFGQGW